MDKEGWWAAVCGVAESWTRLTHTHTHTRTHNFLISITTSNLFLVLLWKVDLSPLGELFHPPAYLVPSLC